ncbi:MAG: ATPase P [Anaerolineae bacterium]|nr:ATPase P [Anaerolineae bacterium]
MIELSIPGKGDLFLEHVVFDVNGTLAVDGVLCEGVEERLAELANLLKIHMLTADTHGGQAAIDAQLGITAVRMRQGNEREQKATYVERLGVDRVVAVGNGGNDAGMLQTAAVGIAVLGQEGLNVEALQAAGVVAGSSVDALDLLLKPKRLIASLRR